MEKAKSLRQIEIETLRREIREAGYIGRGGVVVRDERACAIIARAEAGIVALDAKTDEQYADECRDVPLSHWDIAPEALLFHARARGVEGRANYERFSDVGGMGGYTWVWCATGEPLSVDERDRIVGFRLDTTQAAPFWASDEFHAGMSMEQAIRSVQKSTGRKS